MLEFYALSTDRSASAVRRFLSHFLARPEPCADKHWIPEYADAPRFVLNTEDQILDYLERHANEPYGLYWNDIGSDRQAMAFYTRDGHVILGLADDPLDPAMRLREIGKFVGATHCLLTSEQRPPDTAAEFIELCSRFSSIAPPVSQAASGNDKPIELRGTDLLLCHNVLNEVLNGVPVADFATRVGDERDARRLLDLASSAITSSRDDRALTLQGADALFLRHAIEVVLAEIDDIEFATRLGESKARVRQFLQRRALVVDDFQLRTICDDVLLSLQSDIVSLAELTQIIRDANLPGGLSDAAIVAVLRRMLEQGIAIGSTKNVGGTHVKFIAWCGTVDARCNRAMAEAARHDSDSNRGFSFWLCLPQNVDEAE